MRHGKIIRLKGSTRARIKNITDKLRESGGGPVKRGEFTRMVTQAVYSLRGAIAHVLIGANYEAR